ncbi:MAG: histidine phosphatase family protein [Proteobacteria bacterium]|nr:histidine phosphatase family protein [Pseudomonadota bacterium]
MNKQPLLAILRHADYEQPADTPSAWLPYALTAEGRTQAEDAGETLADFLSRHGMNSAPAIDSSRMLRAWQTASIIGGRLGVTEIAQFDGLAERSVGAVANLTTGQIEALLAADPRYESPPEGWKSTSDYRLPFQGAESLTEAGRRVADHLLACMEALEIGAPGHMKIVVAHGASLRHAAMHLGLLTPKTVGSVSMYHARPIFLTRDGGRWQILEGEWKPRKHKSQSDEYGVA